MGITLYQGGTGSSTEWECIVTLAWPSDKRQGEGMLLNLAKDGGAVAE
jgi:hypothetical protein